MWKGKNWGEVGKFGINGLCACKIKRWYNLVGAVFYVFNCAALAGSVVSMEDSNGQKNVLNKFGDSLKGCFVNEDMLDNCKNETKGLWSWRWGSKKRI